MKSALAAAVALALLAAPAFAEDTGCAAATELLRWTAETLIDIRDGHTTGVAANARYIVDAANVADDRAREAGWPDAYFGVLDELSYLAATIRDKDGRADPAEAGSILAYADALAETTAARCGADSVPVFVRAGQGDPAACSRVIDALVRFKEVIPALSRVTGPMHGMVTFAASVNLQQAALDATAAEWSAQTIERLQRLGIDVGAISSGTLAPSPATGSALVEAAIAVAADASSICTGQDIPMLAPAG